MKKLNNWLLKGLILVLPLGFVACSEDDDETKAEFPKQVTITCEAGTEEVFNFTANLDWKLSVDKSWVILSANDIEGQDLQGVAGNQSITLKITDEGMEFAETTAELTLTMGLESRPVAKIVRAAEEYELQAYDDENNVMDTIAIDNNGSIAFVVKANFNFAATDYPEWIEISMDATDDDANTKNTYVSVIDSLAKNPQNGEITFADESGEHTFAIPVSYAGMDPLKINISGYTPWGWTVSMDGTTYTQENMTGGDPITLTDGVTFNVKALNDDVKFFVVEEMNDQLWLTDESGNMISWMRATQNEENKELVTVTIDEYAPAMWSPKERTGCIFAVPAAKYDEFSANLKEGTSMSFIDENINFVLIEFTQKEESAGGMSVKEQGNLDLTCTEGVTDEAIKSLIQYDYSVSEMYSVEAGSATYLTICPMLSETEWDPNTESPNPITICNSKGESISTETLGGIEAGMNMESQYTISFSTPESFTEPLIVIFRGTNWMNLKALVITPAL